ncbi:MAG: DUF2934 domain-containing protein [Proteobacteria bacterium]|nr:DUF2934 domain-containing protein [Pseudomonadota bacterium]
MPSKVSETATKRPRTKLSKSEENILAHHVINSAKRTDRQEMIATAAYYRAEKRGFSGSEADAVQDWLEAEMEVDNELGVFDSNTINFQFLTNETE